MVFKIMYCGKYLHMDAHVNELLVKLSGSTVEEFLESDRVSLERWYGWRSDDISYEPVND